MLYLGGGYGAQIIAITLWLRNVMVCDSDVAAVRDASRNFGYRTVLIAASGALPLAGGELEFVFSSDVIERVAGLKMGVLR